MNSKRKPKEKPTSVLSLVSGKGGVGKTSIALSICRLLQKLGYKVLLIDSDLFTHGATFFLSDEILEADATGIVELVFKTLHSKNVSADISEIRPQMIVHTSYGFDFVPSSSSPKKKYSLKLIQNLEHVEIVLDNLVEVLRAKREYDYIVIDCQAGPVFTTFSNVKNADSVAIVLEPDPISAGTLFNLMGELAEKLPERTFTLFNKFMVKEARGYVAVEEFARMTNSLPPLPFDIEVRRGFLLRKIPVDFAKPSHWFVGLLRVARDFLPEISSRLSKLEKQLENQAVLPIQRKIEVLEKELEKQLTERAMLKEKTIHLFPLSYFILILTIIASTVAILSSSEILALISVLDFSATLIGIGGGIAVLLLIGFAIAWTQQREAKKSERLELTAKLEVELDRTRSQLEGFRALLISKRDELLIPVMRENDTEEVRG